jgi:hypothetical protein
MVRAGLHIPPAGRRSIAIARAVTLRVRDDYGGRDRRKEYEALLRKACDMGYKLVSLAEFHARTSVGAGPGCRWLVLRHDVDIGDVAGNASFFAIERNLGAQSTFYFRQSTARTHERLMQPLIDAGFEVGYHFEEAATVAKGRGLRSRGAVFEHRREIEDLFQSNCWAFRARWNPHLQSVASHGDWINRRLGFTNNELVSSELLTACDLRFEAYGPDLLGRSDVYVSDVAVAPERWARGYGPEDALGDERGPIYMLTHEARWHTARAARARADVVRLVDAVRYAARR